MEKLPLYIETSVVSYLTSRASGDALVAVHQASTRRWWDGERGKYELYLSTLVIQELLGGDEDASQKRLAAVEGLTVLEPNDATGETAEYLLKKGIIPAKAVADAVHLSIAAINKMSFLLTWNYRHIANPFIRDALERAFQDLGLRLPVICNPYELLEAGSHE